MRAGFAACFSRERHLAGGVRSPGECGGPADARHPAERRRRGAGGRPGGGERICVMRPRRPPAGGRRLPLGQQLVPTRRRGSSCVLGVLSVRLPPFSIASACVVAPP